MFSDSCSTCVQVYLSNRSCYIVGNTSSFLQDLQQLIKTLSWVLMCEYHCFNLLHQGVSFSFISSCCLVRCHHITSGDCDYVSCI